MKNQAGVPLQVHFPVAHAHSLAPILGEGTKSIPPGWPGLGNCLGLLPQWPVVNCAVSWPGNRDQGTRMRKSSPLPLPPAPPASCTASPHLPTTTSSLEWGFEERRSRRLVKEILFSIFFKLVLRCNTSPIVLISVKPARVPPPFHTPLLVRVGMRGFGPALVFRFLFLVMASQTKQNKQN